jgi:putative SOS response-associated peptidase YedK
MPLLVDREKYGAWLDPTVSDTEALRELLVPAVPGRLEAYPVATLVNDVKNNGPELVEPLQVELSHGEVSRR